MLIMKNCSKNRQPGGVRYYMRRQEFLRNRGGGRNRCSAHKLLEETFKNEMVLSARAMCRISPKTSFFFEQLSVLIIRKVLPELAGVVSLSLHLLTSHGSAVRFFFVLLNVWLKALFLSQPHLHTASAQQEQQGNFFALTGMPVWSSMLITVIMPMAVFISVRM
jgi:hypothetical protein